MQAHIVSTVLDSDNIWDCQKLFIIKRSRIPAACLNIHLLIWIFKTKSNFTLFFTEYFNSWCDLTKIKHFICFPRLVQTECKNGNSRNWFHHRVICTFIKNKNFAVSSQFFNRACVWTQILKDHWSSIKSPAKNWSLSCG